MKAIITVKDKRTQTGFNTRHKIVSSKAEAVKWAKSFKNRIFCSITIINNGIAENVIID